MQASAPKPHKAFWKENTVWEKPAKKTNPEDKVGKAFSIYIRTRDCLATTGNVLAFKCCTCGRLSTFKNNDA